jgi:hypothetical protein
LPPALMRLPGENNATLVNHRLQNLEPVYPFI